MPKCNECNIGKLKILGTGYDGETVEVECQNPDCGCIYEVEPDGLGEGGFEWVMAKMMDFDSLE